MLLHDKKWSRRRDKYHGCTVADDIGGFIQWHSLRMIRGCLQAEFFLAVVHSHVCIDYLPFLVDMCDILPFLRFLTFLHPLFSVGTLHCSFAFLQDDRRNSIGFKIRGEQTNHEFLPHGSCCSFS